MLSGICFRSYHSIVCSFDNDTISHGRVISLTQAFCVAPLMDTVGPVPLKVSVDGGKTFFPQLNFMSGKKPTVNYSILQLQAT